MYSIPYIIPVTNVLAGNALQDFSFNVPSDWNLHVKEWYFTSTGVFSIYDIVDSKGRHYMSGNLTTPILSTFVQNPTNSNLSLRYFTIDLLVAGGDNIRVSIKDTSGAGNTINMVLNCVAEIPGDKPF